MPLSAERVDAGEGLAALLRDRVEREQRLPLALDLVLLEKAALAGAGIGYALNGAGLICRKMITGNSTDFASFWAAAQPGAETGLADLIKAFDSTVKNFLRKTAQNRLTPPPRVV